MSSPLSPVMFALVAILSFAILVRLVSADTGTSTSFHVGQSINDFSGTGTSSSFESISTGGQFITGQSTSTSFQIDSGFEYFDTSAPKSQNWRWYDDATAETPIVPLESENIAPINIESDNIIKLRIAVAETGGYGVSNVKFKLQYSTSSDFSSNVYDLAETGSCSYTSVWCYGNGVDTDGDVISEKLLSDTDACTGSVGSGCGTHNESGISASTFTHVANAVTEYEFTIK